MQIIYGHENLDIRVATAAAIGTFDGVHLGHRQIIKAAVSEAKKSALLSMALTFNPHPRQVLTPQNKIEILTTLDKKIELLANLGLDYVCVLDFKKIRDIPAGQFCEDILDEKVKTAHLFMGPNFKFGSGGTGNSQWLKTHFHDFKVTELPWLIVDQSIVSSTLIRNLIREGRVETANLFLDRNYIINGKVVYGAGRGAKLGYPTINLELADDLCLPGSGVYLGFVLYDFIKQPALINCGQNPTFPGTDYHCEAHIIDFEGDLYGKSVELEFIVKVRDEIKFPSPESLSEQIAKDLDYAKKWFLSPASSNFFI